MQEDIKALGVDKAYLATELQNKNDQLRRVSSLHQEEKAVLLGRLDEETRAASESRRADRQYPREREAASSVADPLLEESRRAGTHRTHTTSHHHHHSSRSSAHPGLSEDAKGTLRDSQRRMKSAQAEAEAELKELRAAKTRIDDEYRDMKGASKGASARLTSTSSTSAYSYGRK
jgi:hypothetical protein